MSITMDSPSLDIQEQVARIERAQAETRKFAAEQNKLAAEASKLNRDRFFAPFVVLASISGSGILLAVMNHFWR